MVRKQLKKQFPTLKRLDRRGKWYIARMVRNKIDGEYDFSGNAALGGKRCNCATRA